jgi:hypothetical protein
MLKKKIINFVYIFFFFIFKNKLINLIFFKIYILKEFWFYYIFFKIFIIRFIYPFRKIDFISKHFLILKKKINNNFFFLLIIKNLRIDLFAYSNLFN